MAALRFFFYLLMKPVTVGLSFLGILGLLTPSVNPNTWWIPAFSGLFLPGILLLNLFLLGFWAYCRKWWIWLPFCALAVNYNFYPSMYQNPFKELPAPSGKTLRVASYNVEGFYWIGKTTSYGQLQEMFAANEVDVICIQEHCEATERPLDSLFRNIGLPYRQVYFNHRAPWANYGMSIYSRYPIVSFDSINFHSTRNEAMWADIAWGNDTVRIFNNHLQTTDISVNTREYYKQKSIKDWKGQARTLVHIFECLKANFCKRAEQAIQVRRIIDTTRYPVIVCGDFNDTPVSFSFNHIRRPNLKDGFRECGKGYGHSFNGLKRLLRIDFISYGQDFQGIRYHSPELPWSDHNPVILTLSL